MIDPSWECQYRCQNVIIHNISLSAKNNSQQRPSHQFHGSKPPVALLYACVRMQHCTCFRPESYLARPSSPSSIPSLSCAYFSRALSLLV